MALKRLQIEYKKYMEDTPEYYSIMMNEDNLYCWNIILFGPHDSIFEGGMFKCMILFPKTYPNNPPQFKFITPLFHPNIYPDGKVCISILHEGEDVYGYESISERWTPSQSVNSILMSILSIINSPNFESPANIDASVMWKNNIKEYKKRIYRIVAESQDNLLQII